MYVLHDEIAQIIHDLSDRFDKGEIVGLYLCMKDSEGRFLQKTYGYNTCEIFGLRGMLELMAQDVMRRQLEN